MENFDQNQEQNQTQPLPVIQTINNQTLKKPFWQTDVFTVLALVLFWPIGLILMWKYTSWRKWVKGLLTIFFFIGAIPLLFIWTLLFGLKINSFVGNITNPRVANQSKLYSCLPLNSEWGKCTNIKYNFSFEYPAGWNYIDRTPEGLGFSPSDKDIADNLVISMYSSSDWKSEEEAKKFAKGYLGVSSRQETTINGLYATKDYKTYSNGDLTLFATIVDGKITYDFRSSPVNLKEKGITLSNDELRAIFDHMANSFVKER